MLSLNSNGQYTNSLLLLILNSEKVKRETILGAYNNAYSITFSLRSRRLVRAGEERASLNKRLPIMPMINLFFFEESSEKLTIGQSR
jgi:hypothetical protein